MATQIAQPQPKRKKELCVVEVPSIEIVIETGFGYYTYPMIVIKSKMNGEIRNWSSEVKHISTFSRNFYKS